MYDQALTNGLAAIVAHEWPGEEANAKGRMHAANTLLDVIEQHSVAQPDGARLYRGRIRRFPPEPVSTWPRSATA